MLLLLLLPVNYNLACWINMHSRDWAVNSHCMKTTEWNQRPSKKACLCDCARFHKYLHLHPCVDVQKKSGPGPRPCLLQPGMHGIDPNFPLFRSHYRPTNWPLAQPNLILTLLGGWTNGRLDQWTIVWLARGWTSGQLLDYQKVRLMDSSPASCPTVSASLIL